MMCTPKLWDCCTHITKTIWDCCTSIAECIWDCCTHITKTIWDCCTSIAECIWKFCRKYKIITLPGILLLILLILVLLIMEFAVTSKPSYAIHQFSIQYYNNNNSNSPSSIPYYYNIDFAMSLKNRDMAKGLYYDPVEVAFYYQPNLTTNAGDLVPITGLVFRRLYEHGSERVNLFGQVTVPGGGVINASTLAGVSVNGSSLIRVDVVTGFWYKGWFGRYRRRYGVQVAAGLKLDGEGKMVIPKKNKKKRVDLR